jgi:ribosome biogenesis protein ENP2
VYNRLSTEALVPSTAGWDADGNYSGEVFRLNLEVGRFMKSYQIDVGTDDGLEVGLQGSNDVGSVNVGAIAEDTHNLLAFGTSRGTIEFWDSRDRSRIAVLDQHSNGEVTALNFNPNGLSIAAGSSSGIIQLYDLRRPLPFLRKDHGYGFPIKVLKHMTTASQERKLLASDKRIIKIYDATSGDLFTSVEPAVDINDVAWIPDTGMLLTANEGPAQHAFHIPQLGPAPRWCSFLDNLVEEMAEEVQTETYANYKFVTIPELRSLSLAHLVGKSNLLRPYMHGYFVASKLYDQARLIANPYVWEEERAKRIREKVEKERAGRIRGMKKVKVNQNMVDRILKRQEKRHIVDTNVGVLGDERFSKLFEDEEYAVDENSREFKALNPSTGVARNVEPTRRISDTGDSSKEANSDDNEADSDEDVGFRISSSTAKFGDKRRRDIAFGARTARPGRVSIHRHGLAAGEKEVTFVPQVQNKKQPSQNQAPSAKRSEPRRSASTNTFRRM